MFVINVLLWFLFGALIGWLTDFVLHRDDEQDALRAILVGIGGAFLGGLAFTVVLGFMPADATNTADGFSLSGLLIAYIGALVLLGIVNLTTHRRAR